MQELLLAKEQKETIKGSLEQEKTDNILTPMDENKEV
jgi:hypothetical protein